MKFSIHIVKFNGGFQDLSSDRMHIRSSSSSNSKKLSVIQVSWKQLTFCNSWLLLEHPAKLAKTNNFVILLNFKREKIASETSISKKIKTKIWSWTGIALINRLIVFGVIVITLPNSFCSISLLAPNESKHV